MMIQGEMIQGEEFVFCGIMILVQDRLSPEP